MKRNRLPVSIVIPCADQNLQIKGCLDSIDEAVEVVVVLNGAAPEVEALVREYGLTEVHQTEKSLPKALNTGIEHASNECVILIDSDCVFEEGAIRKVYESLQNHLISSGKIVFEHDNFFSSVVANARDYFNSNPPRPWNPFLGMQKSLKDHVGGHYFNDGIYWTEDAELEVRLKEAGVDVGFVFDAKAHHPPLTLKYDLRSAFKYGIGKRIRVEKGLAEKSDVPFPYVIDVARVKGLPTGIYYFIWCCAFIMGYVYQIFADPYKTKTNIA